jgi:hypothetical protein
MERGISSSRILFIVPLPIIFRNGFQFGNSSGHNCSIFDTSDVYLAFYTRADRELISLRSLTFNVTLLSIGDGARPSPPPLIDGRARGGPPRSMRMRIGAADDAPLRDRLMAERGETRESRPRPSPRNYAEINVEIKTARIHFRPESKLQISIFCAAGYRRHLVKAWRGRGRPVH